MKNFFLFLTLLFIATSCDYILKPSSVNVVDEKLPEMAIEAEKDKNGCVADAGFKWSKINQNCIKLIEEGYRLNPTDNLTNLEAAKSAFVIFDASNLNAEVFLPNVSDAILLNRNSINDDFTNKELKFSLKKDYTLSVKDSILFQAAKTTNKAVISTDAEEQ